MTKPVIAFLLGIVPFFLLFALGETFGMGAAFSGIGIFCFICQFFLSRGNPHALFGDWRIILALNAVLIASAVLVLLIEPNAKWQSIVAVISIISSVFGAGLAAFFARKKRV